MIRANRQKRLEWQRRAARKGGIVPFYFEVTPTFALIYCGKCRTPFQRNLISNVNEPTFACPNPSCRAKNWLPITYNLIYK